MAVVALCWQEGYVPPSPAMSIAQLSDEVLRVVDGMKLDRFAISGQSIGGMNAVEIAGRDLLGLAGAIPIEGWTHDTVMKTAFSGDVTINLTRVAVVRRVAGFMKKLR